jgi:hypothetical protein
MFDLANPVLWLIGAFVLVVVVYLLRSHFSAEAREARRRARSHGRVVSKGRGPTVRLAVDIKKPKKDRQ